jgi:alpha/beta superfamily hydrolase
VKENEKTKGLAIGYFGASTGAAAALRASVVLKTDVKAVVSRGGRVDLASSSLPEVEAATLFIVGENDFDVLRLNQSSYEQIKAEKKLIVIPGATHLFEEPGALEEVARVAEGWFKKYFG